MARFFSISEIAQMIGGHFSGDGGLKIRGVASLQNAKDGEIAFLEKESNDELATNASCVIVPENFSAEVLIPIIKCKNPKFAFAQVAKKLHPHEWKDAGWHESFKAPENAEIRASFIGAFVTIETGANIGESAQIHSGVRIGANVTIGDFTVIYPNCVIYDNVAIGSNCVIHAGAIIGADGFGYVRGPEGYVKFPQIGTVVIADEVEIGANSCVDRGALGETRIGRGTKIDNQVQVGHNVQIGERVVIAAQTGISGSTVIESDAVIGGQVGMGDHARILSGAVIGSQAGVLPGKIVRAGVWWGTPVQPLDEYKRQNAHVKGLARLKEEVKELKNRLAEKHEDK